uniref:Uncharacterized protein n=1 Tax=viral metagenome TaxID=1070528 RepID=A0A6C0E3U4_9ZZZZ
MKSNNIININIILLDNYIIGYIKMKIEFDMTTKSPGQPMQMQMDSYPYEQENIDFMDIDNNGEEMEIDELDELDELEFENPDFNQNQLNNIDLAKRDQYLLKIEDEIELRRKFLLEKQKKLEKLSRQNRFLETVKDDYENYHNYIVEQKEGQIRAMNSIKQYVEDLIVSGKLTDEDIRQAKDDQREITNEVKKIREKINEIIGV